ncbi:MAG: copper amine oxidase N-terminal domain-containing protein [Clostridiales bacterium]|nr:copper amine oxidase N-terminal domain-containing protein [Clostridiales bacterium]
MKKLILSLVLMLAVFIPSNVVFAGRSDVALSLEDAYYEMTNGVTGDSYPTLNVKVTGDSLTSMAFHLVLDGADWDTSKMSKYDSNVTVSRSSTSDIQLKFSKEFFKANKNGNTTEFSIPLYAKNFCDGYTYLYVTETPTYMDDAEFLFASNTAGSFSVNYDENAEIYKTGISVLSDVKISDSSNYPAVSGETSFRISISDPNFAIVSIPDIEGTGKYEDNVYCELESSTVLNVKVKEESETGTGIITIKNLTLNRTAEKLTTSPNITVYSTRTITFKTNEGTSKTRKIEDRTTYSCGEYIDRKSDLTAPETSSAAEETVEESEETAGEEITEENSLLPEGENVLTFTVGTESYVINGETVETSSPCIVSEGSTLLPLRALSKALGVADEDIIYDAETKTVVIIKDGNRVSIEQNGDYMYVNGKQQEVSTPAINYNSCMYLPVRDICSALVIEDDNIGYDAETKTVTVIF